MYSFIFANRNITCTAQTVQGQKLVLAPTRSRSILCGVSN